MELIEKVLMFFNVKTKKMKKKIYPRISVLNNKKSAKPVQLCDALALQCIADVYFYHIMLVF